MTLRGYLGYLWKMIYHSLVLLSICMDKKDLQGLEKENFIMIDIFPDFYNLFSLI